MKYKTFPILLAFLCMGFGDVVNPLVSLVEKSISKFSIFQTQLITLDGLHHVWRSLRTGRYFARTNR